MKNLTHELKRMLNALAYAGAGDNMTLRQKTRVMLSGNSAPSTKPEPAVRSAARSQVGLYLGSELPADIIEYVEQTCLRLKHGLTVLTFQSESEARALLAPYQASLDAAGIETRVDVLTGEPPAALAHALRRRPEIAFLVCNEAGYFGHGLLKGTQRKDNLPLPVVLVASKGASIQAAPQEQQVSNTRVA